MRENPEGKELSLCARHLGLIALRKGLRRLCVKNLKLREGVELMELGASGEKTRPQPHFKPEERGHPSVVLLLPGF